MKITSSILFFLCSIFFLSCTKVPVNEEGTSGRDINGYALSTSTIYPNCYDCAENTQSYTDTVEHPTILGSQTLNPYTLANMTQAYINMSGHAPTTPFAANYLYVKFSPANLTQLATLEDEDIDLTEYPLDRKVIFEGDYYVQPGKGIEDLPDLYAVVPVGYSYPADIPYIILTPMYIPDNIPFLEDEALFISGNLEDDPTGNNLYENSEFFYLGVRPSRQEISYRLPCPTLEPENSCGPPGPPTGPGGTGGFPPVGSQNCSHYPSGTIKVQNELATDNTYRAVRNVRVVVRRGFKFQRLFTDNTGKFATTKYFKNKYTILVKFKNNYARVARMWGFRLWEQYFPIKINFGNWDNLLCEHAFTIAHPSDTRKIKTSHWAAAVTHNGVQEHREMCQQEGVGVPPTALHIMVAAGKSGNAGNTVMFNKIRKSGGTIPSDLLEYTLFGILGAVPYFPNVIEAWQIRSPDIVFGFGGNYISFYSTDQYCEVVYHELTHAAHYNKVGNFWWTELGLDEELNPGTRPYGNCCQPRSPRIAVAEFWAYHMGHYLSDKKWGFQCTSFPEQGTDNKNFENTLMFSNGGGYSSQHNFLENYDPTRAIDPFRWIPKGLLNDMMDGGLESPQSTITDNVSGFNNYQFFQALENDVNSMPSYKAKFLQQNNYLQQNQINDLFFQYGY